MQRQKHQQEVLAFLQKHFSSRLWEFSLPKGSGDETYFASGNNHTYFVKLGAHLVNYQTMASMGLTPPVIVAGYLDDGTSIMIQLAITGRKPSWKDYPVYLERIAMMIDTTHHSHEVKRGLPEIFSELYSVIGLESLARIQQRWEHYKAQVPTVSEFVDESLADLTQQVQRFLGAGSVASHNDICNANWLISDDGKIYLIDLESMSLEDPAVDVGAILWWYYPPELRQRFLEIVGYANDEQFQNRMRVRMAMHCLNILLPRERSFDRFDPGSFAESLIDFRAILAGKENPQGYEE